MVRPTRRKTLIGMGMLAVGSGAAFSNAAFQTSTTPSADLRVVVEEELNFRPNPDAPDNNDNILDTDDFEDFFEGEDIADGDGDAFDGDVEPPLAATNGQPNGDLELFAVAPTGTSDTFSELFILENDSTDSVAVGVAYDRGTGTDDNRGQYGEDIDVNGESGLPATVPRGSYKLEVTDPGPQTFVSSGATPNALISPAVNGSDGIGSDEVEAGSANSVGQAETVDDDRDRPANAVVLDPGEEIRIDLVVDTDYDDNTTTSVREQAGISFDGGEFGEKRATVDLLDEITVGTLTDEP